jgi:DNA-binding LacI/PurR family transcriptional regulator
MSTSKPTIHDVASLAGVSKSLVSLALSGSKKVSEKSRERILAASESLGYRRNAAARSLAVQRSQTMGVLILDLHNPVFAEILDGVQSELRDYGYSTMLVTGGKDPVLEKTEIDSLLQFQIEGLILISHRLSSRELTKIANEVPTVTVTREDIISSALDTVCNDDVAGARLAVDHLVSLGHSKIVCLSGGDNPVSHSRVQGYRLAMQQHGKELLPVLFPEDSPTPPDTKQRFKHSVKNQLRCLLPMTSQPWVLSRPLKKRVYQFRQMSRLLATTE